LQTIKNTSDLKPFKIGGYLGSGWIDKNIKGKGFQLHMAATLPQCIKMLDKKRFDILIAVDQVFFYQVKEFGLKGEFIKLNTLSKLPFHLLIGKISIHNKIIPQFNETIKKMKTDKAIEKIFARYR